MEYNITGVIDAIHPITERGNYKSRKLWLTTTETYPQTLEVECGGAKIDLFNDMAVGQTVTIDINLRGRKWQPEGGEAKVFVTLSAWRVSVSKPSDVNSQPSYASSIPATETKDDLPF